VIVRILSATAALAVLVACSDRPRRLHSRNARQVVIDLGRQHAWLIEGEKTLLDTQVTTGRDAYRTPLGNFAIMRKQRVYQSTVYGSYVSNFSGRIVLSGVDRRKHYNLGGVRFEGAQMNYYMEFASGIGMHAGDLTPYPSSHGCVRLPISAARKFFELLDIGCIVRVQNSGRPLAAGTSRSITGNSRTANF
jgi:lipoprotein-anchoring transpeptidase ErfK/SrfK